MKEKSNKGVSIVKSSFSVTMVLLLAKALSFVRDMLMASTLGATSISDAILLSTSLLLLLSTFIRSPFQSSYLPLATDAYLLGDEKQKDKFFGTIYGFSLTVGLILMVIEGILLQPLLTILVPGLTSEAKAILYLLMLVQLPIVPLSFLGAVNDGHLKLLNKFGISEISNAIITIFYIFYFLIFKDKISPISLGICVVIAYLFVFIFRTAIVYKNGISPRWHFNFKGNSSIKELCLAMLPFIIATSARELNTLIDKSVASLLDSGSITMQSYAGKLTVTEVGLIARAISFVVYSQAAKKSTMKDEDGLRSVVVTGLRFVNTLMIPCCIFTILFKNEIITILFGHGKFTSENIIITANTMMIYAIGMIASGIDEVLTRIMQATKHRKFPATLSIIIIFMNTVLNLLLYKRFGIYGLAAASSFVTLVKVPFAINYVNKNIVSFRKEDHMILDFVKIFASTLIVGIVIFILKSATASYINSNLITLVVFGCLGVFMCFVAFALQKNEYALAAVNKIKKIIKK